MSWSSRLAANLPDTVVARAVSVLYGRAEPELGHLDEICARGGVMIDVGAWYGPWSQRLVRRADRLIAIEPTSRHRALRAILPARADVLCAAASDHAGVGLLWNRGRGDGAEGLSSLLYRDIHASSVSVPLIRIDDLGVTGLTFIKIDVEGHELAVLRGAESTIRRDMPRLLIEVDSQIQPVTPLLDTLGDWGYVGWVLQNHSWVRLDAGDLIRRQAGRSKVANRGLVHRLIWPYPRYENSALFLPVGSAAPGSARSLRGRRPACASLRVWSARQKPSRDNRPARSRCRCWTDRSRSQ
jgi:FkbM family methyltransferase